MSFALLSTLLASSAFAAPLLPELYITEIEIIDAVPATWRIAVPVANVGNAPASPVCVDLWSPPGIAPEVGDVSDHRQCVVNLDPGEKAVLYFKLPPASGWWDAIVDTEDWIAESDETNNVESNWLQ